jgi:hypothetical protein
VYRRIETSRNNLSKYDAVLEQNKNIVKLRVEECRQQKARHMAGLFIMSQYGRASIMLAKQHLQSWGLAAYGNDPVFRRLPILPRA